MQTVIPVRHLAGLGRMPRDRSALSRWMERRAIPVRSVPGNGGLRETVKLADLPEPERQAFAMREAAERGLPPGTYDDEAHLAFLKLPRRTRERAERRADVARFLLTEGTVLPWPAKVEEVERRFGPEGASEPSLRRLLRAVDGIEPVNFAPALVPGYRRTGRSSPMTPAAWAYFLNNLREAAPQFPLRQAWRDVRDRAPEHGWDWPSYETITRHWNRLTEAERLTVRYGREEATKRLTMPQMRRKPDVFAKVSLDGRTLDLWARMEDGRVLRPTMIALVDVGSGRVLGFELVESENAAATVRVICDVVRRFGIFDTLQTDNGSAFAGNRVAGGARHRFRGKRRAKDEADPKAVTLGVCAILGIRTQFTIPGNAKAKFAERTFASLSRIVDDRPEFARAHAGHGPGAAPTADRVPVPIEEVRAIYAREVDRYNAEPGRRSEGARGRSYDAVFREGLAERQVTVAGEEQLRLARYVYTSRAVDRFGRVKVDGWTYGGPETQDALLPFHGGGQRVQFGRDPADFDAPAIAFDADGREICRGIPAIVATPYDSSDGLRTAKRYTKAARAKVQAAQEATDLIGDHEFAALNAQLGGVAGPPPEETPPAPTVIGAHFGGPLRPRPAPGPVRADPDAARRRRAKLIEGIARAEAEKAKRDLPGAV